MKINNWWAIVCVVFLVLAAFSSTLQAAESLPDTGQTKCYDADGAEINPCPAPGAAFYGQDAQYNASERQHSYTKLDQNGGALPVSATTWYQVKDNVTGLIWEVKTDDGSVHDKDNRYTWYDSNPATNGGNAGTAGDGTDTEDFIAVLNAGSGYCGHSDWRLPTIKELSWIVDSGRSGRPYINTEYFPRTQSSGYWSSTTGAYYTNRAWYVDFGYGYVSYYYKSNSLYVRAVRSGQ